MSDDTGNEREQYLKQREREKAQRTSTVDELENKLRRMFTASQLERLEWKLVELDGHALYHSYDVSRWNFRLYSKQFDYVVSYELPNDADGADDYVRDVMMRDAMMQAFEYGMTERVKHAQIGEKT